MSRPLYPFTASPKAYKAPAWTIPVTRAVNTGIRIWEFIKVCFSAQGLASPTGRTLIWGKIRRSVISFSPRYARHLKAKHGLEGGCRCCGTSCNLLFECPQWNKATRLCGIYETRPAVCRLFPITPKDLVEVKIANPDGQCGFNFLPKA